MSKIVPIVELLPELRAKLPPAKFVYVELLKTSLDQRVLVCDSRFSEDHSPLNKHKTGSNTINLDEIKKDDIRDLKSTKGEKTWNKNNKNRHFVPKDRNGVFING